jgi:hypothetical protein
VAAPDGPAQQPHGCAVAVIGAAVAVLAHGAAELRHGHDHDVFHAVAEVAVKRGEPFA